MHRTIHAALDATARFRGVEIAPLSSVVDDLAELRARTCRAYRNALGVDGVGLPFDFGEVVEAVITFADPLAGPAGACAGARQAADGSRRRSQQRSQRGSFGRGGTGSDADGRVGTH